MTSLELYQFSSTRLINSIKLKHSGELLSSMFNRKRQLEYNMMRMIWKIDIDEIELQKSRTGVGSKVGPCSIKIGLIF